MTRHNKPQRKANKKKQNEYNSNKVSVKIKKGGQRYTFTDGPIEKIVQFLIDIDTFK